MTGRLVFEDTSGTAKWIETANTPDAPQNVQNSIQMPIQVNSDPGNYARQLSESEYGNHLHESLRRRRKQQDYQEGHRRHSIQLECGDRRWRPAKVFSGQIEIQEGAIRLINKTFSFHG